MNQRVLVCAVQKNLFTLQRLTVSLCKKESNRLWLLMLVVLFLLVLAPSSAFADDGLCPAGSEMLSKRAMGTGDRQREYVVCYDSANKRLDKLIYENGQVVTPKEIREAKRKDFVENKKRVMPGLWEKVSKANGEDAFDILVNLKRPDYDIDALAEGEKPKPGDESYEKVRGYVNKEKEKVAEKFGDKCEVHLDDDITKPFFPFVHCKMSKDEILALNSKHSVISINDFPIGGEPASNCLADSQENYASINAGALDVLGWDGDGIRVGILEEYRPDTVIRIPCALPGELPSNNCYGAAGENYLCFCPESDMFYHPRVVAGIISSDTATHGGIADEAEMIFANWEGGCWYDWQQGLTAALNWAITAQGANVINYSYVFQENPTQKCNKSEPTGDNNLFDYWESNYPYVSFFTGGGNDNITCLATEGHEAKVANQQYNGLTVSAVNVRNTTDRTDDVTHGQQNWINPNPEGSDRELPHIVAPGYNIDDEVGAFTSAGNNLNPPDDIDSCGEQSSIATPHLSALAADLMELNSSLIPWPEIIYAGLMTSADEDIDGTILSLNDGIDDHDGVGEVNAGRLYRYMNPYSSRSPETGTHYYYGHDGNMIDNYAWGEYTYYSVRIPANGKLKATLFWTARDNCGYPPGDDNCETAVFPDIDLYLVDDSYNIKDYSESWDNNWEYINYTNNSESSAYLYLIIYIASWDITPSYTYYGIAWDTE